MTAVLRMKLPQPVRALKLHTMPRAEAPASARAETLFGLREQADQQAADRQLVLSCVEQISQGLGQVPGMVAQNLEEVSALVTELGLAVAREVVGAAVDQGLVDTTAVVLRCLSNSVQGVQESGMRIQLAPDDLSPVLEELSRHPEVEEQVAQVEFVPNPHLSRGSAQVDTGSGRLVYDPQEVLTRIADEVRREAAGGAS